MKLAFPTNDRKTLATRTGRCSEFAIVTIQNENSHIDYVKNLQEHNHTHDEPHEHEHSHEAIIKVLEGIDMVFVKNIGKYLQQDFEQQKIRYEKIKEENIATIIQNYKNKMYENSHSK